ncbi:hypothetical protein WDU94_003550 [Cyamophila willieti]
MDQKNSSETAISASKSSKSSCEVDDVFHLPELTEARLEFEQLYPKIIKPFQIQSKEIEEEENDIPDLENFEEYENEDFYEPSEPSISLGQELAHWINKELDKNLPPDEETNEFDIEGGNEEDKVKESNEELMIQKETNEVGKEKVHNLYKIFLDRYRRKNVNEYESSCSGGISKEDPAKTNLPSKTKHLAKTSEELSYEDQTEDHQTCPNNEFEILGEEWNIVTAVNHRLEFQNNSYLNHYVLRPPLFPTKDGHIYHQEFVLNEKYSWQYSDLMYRYLKEKLNRCIANGTFPRKNMDNMDVIGNNKIDLELFNYITIAMIYYRKVELLRLLCKALALQKELKIVKIENARIKHTHGVAMLLAMNRAGVEKLHMYNFFDKGEQIFDNEIFEKSLKQILLDMMKLYEYEKFVQRRNDRERANTDCQITELQDLLSYSVQIKSPNKPNPDKYKAINKCCFVEKEVFQFSGGSKMLDPMINNAVNENNSLSFVEKLRRIKNIGNKSHLNMALYKYCMTSFGSLKSLSCNYHYIADPAGSVIKSICGHKTLECLQLFIEPPLYLKLNAGSQHVNIISDDIWQSCKESCQQLRVHLVMREMRFSFAEKFIKKSIPLYSIHMSSGSIVEDSNKIQPLLKNLMENFPENLQVVSINLWKHNEDLDNTLTTLFQKLKHLQILEYSGHVIKLKDTVEKISKVKHTCVKRIILTVNNHSKQETLQVYRQSCQAFQTDGVAFSLSSLNE